MTTTKKLLPICLFTLILAACDSGGDDGTQPTTTGTISGVVNAAVDQSPVANAEVTIGAQNSTSTVDGNFELSNVPTGSAVIRAEASGFDTYSMNIQVQEGQNNHNIQLEKSIYERDPFTMYLPPEIEEVRGVLFFLTGGGGDGRPWIRGDLDDFEAAAGRQLIAEIMETYGLAFIGNDNSHYADFFPYQTMLSALEDFADASGHTELADAPLLPFGYSVGGRAAINFAFIYPERTIGAYSYKGVIYQFSDQDWETISNIPVFLHMGELDTEVGSSVPIPEQFEPNRNAGALWAAGIENGVGHEFAPPMEFMTNWMEELIIARIPDMMTPGSIPVLNIIAEESGWLGDLNTFEIMPYAEFQGDPGAASWFPSEETAQAWRTIFE
jgi:pimeloyl-ACP methyl ester carboxylesterase